MKIKIKKEYLTLVPRLGSLQFKSLLQSIKEDGQHLPIIVNEKGYILDGHTRFEACNQLKIKPKYEVKKFDDPDEEKRYVIIVNLSRRQLTLFQKAEVLYEWWKKEKAEGWARRGQNAKRRREGKPIIVKERLNKRLAKMLGCQHNTASNAMTIITEGDSNLLARCRNGTLSIMTAFRMLRKLAPSSGRGYNLRHSKCLLCNAVTIKNEDCHVHNQLCCSECEWGV